MCNLILPGPKAYIISIQVEDKQLNIEEKDGKLFTSGDLEPVEGAKIFFDALKDSLQNLWNSMGDNQ